MSASAWIYFKNKDEKKLEFEQYSWKLAVETALEFVKKDDVEKVMIFGGGAIIWDFYRRGFFLEQALNEETGEIDICLTSPDPNYKGELDLMWDGIFGEKKIKKRLLKEGRKYLF
ncbi:MAG: hypothetical protein AMJ89_05935 [candidate division Zixibacteria bacterium SM23_73]|nr:MAG: hypothetical protein AMJ89_05935 [candidate division Zixibacteria bacterium SM23_73]